MSGRLSDTSFEARLGHRFVNPGLLTNALTHASRHNRRKPDNRRLEFLGDRVLGLVIARLLLTTYPDDSVGVIAPRYNMLVSGQSCAMIARQLGLGDALVLGHTERQSGGRAKEAILADAMEAVIAAIYLDAGLEAAERVIGTLWAPCIDKLADDMRDAKTALQEFVLARGDALPIYEIADRAGPDHAPRFTVCVSLSGGETERATARSRRAAEQVAARALLARLNGQT